MTAMINDIVEASATPRLTIEDVSLHTVWNEALKQVIYHFPQCNVEFRYDIGHSEMLSADREKLIRVFANLVKNAIEAMDGKGIITLTAEDPGEGDRLRVSVTNSDSFIPATDLPSLFEPFQSRERKRGMGLGLTIVKRFVESHGGTVACESSKDQGTSFRLTLPMKRGLRDDFLPNKWPTTVGDVVLGLVTHSSQYGDQQDLETVNDLIRAQSGEPIRILIVDDESLYVKLLKSYIEPFAKSRGITVLSASSPEDALNLAAQLDFDTIICDVDLQDPAMNGYDVVSTLRSANVSAYICIHSNRLMPEDTERSLAAGADVFFPKPMARLQFYRILNASSRKKVVA